MNIIIYVDLDAYTMQEVILNESNSYSVRKLKKILLTFQPQIGQRMYLDERDIHPDNLIHIEEAKVRDGNVYFGRYKYLCDGFTITNVVLTLDEKSPSLEITIKP